MKTLKKESLFKIPSDLVEKIKSYDYEIMKEFTIGFILGLFFSFYGFYLLNFFNKKKIKRNGVYYGCVVSILFIAVLSIAFLFYCSYVIDIKNKNNAMRHHKNKSPKIEIIGFSDYVKSNLKSLLPISKHPYVYRRHATKKIV